MPATAKTMIITRIAVAILVFVFPVLDVLLGIWLVNFSSHCVLAKKGI